MSDTAPDDRRYLETHEWHKLDGDSVTIGISQFAADELTDITFVDLPKVGSPVQANQRFGEIESVKATADLYSGVSGTITAVNDALRNEPGLVNKDPFGQGWMIRVQVTDPGQIQQLLTAQQYVQKAGQ
jgi:glycine cleavage system H protein